ncbi:hypothetical protein C8R46DRAFT_1083106 [Mycena filopes]|nr:hypothetical protein C8R46DRAFT_1083106 [Mycena filopes]
MLNASLFNVFMLLATTAAAFKLTSNLEFQSMPIADIRRHPRQYHRARESQLAPQRQLNRFPGIQHDLPPCFPYVEYPGLGWVHAERRPTAVAM